MVSVFVEDQHGFEFDCFDVVFTLLVYSLLHLGDKNSVKLVWKYLAFQFIGAIYVMFILLRIIMALPF